MKQSLNFEEFPKPSYSEWLAAVEKELAGKSFDSLIWQPTDGITLQPYYHQTHRKLVHVNPTRKDWSVGQWIDYIGDKETNHQIIKSLEGGANFIHLNIPSTVQSIDFSILFKDVFLEYIEVAITFGNNDQLHQQFSRFCNDSNSSNWKAATYFKHATIEEIEERYNKVELNNKSIHTLCVDASAIQDKGGSAIDAIVYALIEGKEILNRMIARGHKIDDLAANIRFRFSTDTSYFQEIAKYKAFRILWAQVVNAYQPEHNCSINTIIDSVSSTFSMATLDAENNLLRSTISSMAAAIGGADTITNLHFNYFLDENQTSSSRYARNILHLLKEESYFDAARDAVKGSFYIEELIYQTADRALSKFIELSEKPYTDALMLIQSSVMVERDQKVKALESGSKVVLGVNKYPNKKDPRLTSKLKPIGSNRIAEELESNIRNTSN